MYWRATGDDAFLRDAGAEILLETARFWASRVARDAEGRCHLRRVIGHDEYHPDVDDNAYTNGMAPGIWNGGPRSRGCWPARWAALAAALAPEEPGDWRDVAARLVTGEEAAPPLIEQFVGFFALAPLDLAEYAPHPKAFARVIGPARTARSQVIKQADVVMLLATRWDDWSPEVRAANFRYYARRGAQGSSLSPAIHALVAARLGDPATALGYFRQATAVDRDEGCGEAAGGVHVATLGGLWQAAIHGFAGLTPEAGEGLRLAPQLPDEWDGLRFAVRWRGRVLHVALRRTPAAATATLVRGAPLPLHLGTLRHQLEAGQPWTYRRDERGHWAEAAEDAPTGTPLATSP